MVVVIVLSVLGVMVFGFFLVKRMDVFLKKNGTAPERAGRDGDASASEKSDAARSRREFEREFEREGVWIREEKKDAREPKKRKDEK